MDCGRGASPVGQSERAACFRPPRHQRRRFDTRGRSSLTDPAPSAAGRAHESGADDRGCARPPRRPRDRARQDSSRGQRASSTRHQLSDFWADLLASYFLILRARLRPMTLLRSSPRRVRSSAAGSDERHRLDRALRAATLDPDDLEGAQTRLLARLFRRSDDFTATTALQALNTFSAGRRADDCSDAPEHLRIGGLSSLERMRHRIRANGKT